VKRVAMIAFWAAVTLCGLALLWTFRTAAILFLVSMGVAAAVRPLVDRLRGRGLSLKSALALTYFVCLVVVGALTYILAARLVVELPLAIDRLVEGYRHVATAWPWAGGYRQFVSGLLPTPSEFEQAVAEIEAASVAGQAVDTTVTLLNAVGQVLLVLVLSIYWSSGRDSFERLWLSFLPARKRQRAQTVWIATRRNVGSHMRRELVLSVLAGFCLMIGLRLSGCELWALATVSVLVLRLVPLLGGAAAVLAAVAIAAASGWWPALAAGSLTLVLLAGLRFFVAPRMLQVERQLDPILAIIVILALAAHFGLAGLVAAPFVAATIQTIFSEIIAARAVETELPSIDELNARLDRLERRFRWHPPSPTVSSLMSRLQYLLERATSR
jgi:putative permease